MRKRLYTRNVGVLFSEESYKKLVNITDETGSHNFKIYP